MASSVCPACGAPELHVTTDGSIECHACGAHIALGDRSCPACGQLNPETAQSCGRCGEPLTVFAQVMTRHEGPGTPRWLSQVRSRAGTLKQEGTEAAQRRLETLQAIDSRRIQSEMEAASRQRDKDRRTLLVGALASIAIVGMIAVVAALVLLR